MTAYLRFGIICVFVLAAVRGGFVYHLALNPNFFYSLTSVLMMTSGLFVSWKMFQRNDIPELINLFNLIKLNLVLCLFYSVVVMCITLKLDVSSFYVGLGFPAIFFLLKVKERFLETALIIVLLVTILGLILLTSLHDYAEMARVHSVLRPNDAGVARIGLQFVGFGYQGDNHDAANVLVFTIPFLFANIMYQFKRFFIKKIVLCILAGFALKALLLTGSAANIVVCFMGLIVMFGKNKPFILVLLLLGLFVFFEADVWNKYAFFYSKFSGDKIYSDEGMLNALNMTAFLSSIPSILFGFGYVFDVLLTHSEMAFIKLLVSLGLCGFTVLMMILFSPLYYIRKIRCVIKSVDVNKAGNGEVSIAKEYTYLVNIALASVSGSISLIHYGSLFRITSIGVFILLLSLFFRQYLKLTQRLSLCSIS